MRIAIVGAGVAGLQTADILSADGHKCLVFERREGPGGVWRENYDGYALQVPAALYELEGVAHSPAGAFPAGADVQRYIEALVAARCLTARCSLYYGASVTRLEAREDGTWTVHVADGATHDVDYCVVATGMYDLPYLPDRLRACGAYHSSEFVDASVARDQRVVVVGGGKSAIDCAVAASRCARSVVLVSRTLHWPVPRRILGLIPFQYGTYSRLGHLLLPFHWSVSERAAWWHRFMEPLKRTVWGLLERIFAWQFGMAEVPTTPLEVDLFHGGQILTTELREAVAAGRVRHVVDDYEPHVRDADLVVAATGFTKSYSLFDADVRARLDEAPDGLWLYKNVLPPSVDGLAFVGSEVSTFNNPLTQRLQAAWLADLLARRTRPSEEVMRAYVERERTWKRSWMPDTRSRAALVQLHMTHYHDVLTDDMGWSRALYRWWEWVLPLTARHYSATEPPSVHGDPSTVE